MPQVILIGNDEQRLVKRLQEGDKTAAREFYTRYGGSLAGVCVRYIADEEDVKDVIQNALVHIFSHITDFKYRGSGSMEAWVVRIAVNESLKFLRTKVQYELLQPDYDVIDDSEDDPSVRDIPSDIIRQMLNRLYVFEGKSHQEIASLLGIKKDSSASQLLRAKSMLAQMIRKYNNNNNPRR